MRARHVEVEVAEHRVAGLDERLAVDRLGTPPLMDREHVRVAGELLDDPFEVKPALRAGVRLVADL